MWRFSAIGIAVLMGGMGCQPLPASVTVSIEPAEPMSIDVLMARVQVDADSQSGDGIRPS